MIHDSPLLTGGIVLLAAVVFSALATGRIRKYALENSLIDHPNSRSSHSVPTPRGGGLAMVLAFSAGLFALWLMGLISGRLMGSLVGPGLLVAGVGFADDRGHVPAGWRLMVHIAAAGVVIAGLGGPPALNLGLVVLGTGWASAVVCGLAAVWLINLYNFMDGIDGLAGGEAVSVALTALILLAGKGRSDLAAGAGLAGASALGFLFWNWPPAKIFMGDVGSGFLGVILAGLALASAFEPGPWPVVWLILLALFGVDATVTLARRLARKARVYQAHREHAYQHAARRWGHRRVSMAALAVNLGYLFPLAWISLHYPAWALDALAAAWLPLIGLALVLGAGRPESSQ